MHDNGDQGLFLSTTWKQMTLFYCSILSKFSCLGVYIYTDNDLRSCLKISMHLCYICYKYNRTNVSICQVLISLAFYLILASSGSNRRTIITTQLDIRTREEFSSFEI